jgi:hypothetical protein
MSIGDPASRSKVQQDVAMLPPWQVDWAHRIPFVFVSLALAILVSASPTYSDDSVRVTGDDQQVATKPAQDSLPPAPRSGTASAAPAASKPAAQQPAPNQPPAPAPSPSRAPLEAPLPPSQSLAPSTPESQPANPFAEASLNSDPLALSPNMIGDFFGGGTGVISGVPIGPGTDLRFRPVQIPNPAGSVLGTLKVADDSSPLPRDRVFFDYDFFNDVPFVPNGIDVNRFLFGVEKTFFDGRYSLEVRVPFGSSLTDNLTTEVNTTTFAMTTPVEDEFQLGNVTLGAKALLYRDETLAASGGLFVTTPTASDLTFNFVTVTGGVPTLVNRLEVENRAVHVAPYLGALWTPSERLFVQGFFQVDLAANGQPVTLTNNRTSSRDIGTLTDQDFAYVDVGGGYWLRRSEVLSLAAIFEVHYNVSLDGPPLVQSGSIKLGSAEGSINLVNLVIGATLRWQQNKTISLAYVVPVGAGGDEQFSGEFQAQFNWFFGR